MIDASPESIRVSPQESSQNGIAVLTSATTRSNAQLWRSCRSASRVPTAKGTRSASVSAARPRRPVISVAGESSRTATLMNKKEAPQIAASASSMTRFRRLTIVLSPG